MKKSGRGFSLPTLIAQILPTSFAQKGLEKDYYKWQIFSLWNNVVGKNIASHAQPVRMMRGVLYAVVDHSAWMHELQFMKQELVDRLNREIAALAQSLQLTLNLTPIQDIRFFLGSLPVEKHGKKLPPKDVPISTTPPPPEVVHEAQEASKNCADPEMRSLLERLWIKTQSFRKE